MRTLLVALALMSSVALVLMSRVSSQSLANERVLELEMRYDVRGTKPGARGSLVSVLPRDIPGRQKVLRMTISPEPARRFERNGNLYASFDLESSGATMTEIRIRFAIWIRRCTFVKQTKPPHDDSLAGNDAKRAELERQASLRPEKWQNFEHPQLRSLASSVPPGDTLGTVRALGNLVIDRLAFGAIDPGDNGALRTLERGKGDCTDYSDLFVALCRARGIPARTLRGYTVPWRVTPKHDWAEVYIEGRGWLPFDPARGEFRRSHFDEPLNVYVTLSRSRRDPVLRGYNIYWYRGALKVEHELHVVGESSVPDAGAVPGSAPEPAPDASSPPTRRQR